MGRIAEIVIQESLGELKTLARQTRNYRIKLRLTCLIYSKSKRFKTQTDLSTHLGVDYSTLKRWLKQYKDEGLASLLTLASGGNKKSMITPPIHAALADRLESSSNPFRGYWDAQTWIKEVFKKELQYNTVRTYLIRHFKTKLKTPRKSHYKKDEQAIEAFFKTSKYI
ncbi:transposase [Candidatus Dependentiae bacterium]|nr:MAG: transposase [Candidatus Dependentiae bacterium]